MQLRSRLPLVLLALLVGLQLFLPSRVWILLLCAVGGMLVAAYFWARSLAYSVQITRSLRYVWAQVGDLLEEQFVLRNRGWWPVLWAELADESTLPDYPSDQVVSTESEGSYRWRTRTICKRRGVFSLGPWTLRMGDPFGLFSVIQRYEQSNSLLIVPPVMDLPSLTLPQGVAAGRSVARQQATDWTLNISGTRRYVPGDPLRRIHWPSTARHQTLISKTFDAEISGDLWIVLDLDARVQAGEGEESTEEYGVILAASLVDRVLRQNRAVGLVSYGARETFLVPDRGEGQLWRVLRTLAQVEAGESAPLKRVLEEMRTILGHRTTVALITPSADPSWVESLWPLLQQGISLTAVLLDPASFGGQGDLSVVRSMLAGLGAAVHIVPRGYPFRYSAHMRLPAGRWEFKATASGKVVVTQRPREVAP